MDVRIPTQEELRPKPVSEGVYKARSKTTVKRSSTNKDMIEVEYTLLSQGPNPTEQTIGRKVFENVVIAENTLWRVDQYCQALTSRGIYDLFQPGEQVSSEILAMRISNETNNKECVVTVGVEVNPDTNEPRNVVKGVKALA